MTRLIGLVGLALALGASIAPAQAQEASQQETMCRAAPAAPPPMRAAPSRRGRVVASGPTQALAAANQAARQRPESRGFQAARQIYTYAPGALYELYASPNYISSILLEPGETLNDIAAGDTARWMVTETTAETELDGRTIVLVKPQTNGLRTNIVLVTDRRTYLVEAVAQEGDVYSAQIAWCYPQTATMTRADHVASLNFAYRVRTSRGRTPNWAPLRVFDDGRRTWIEFPPNVAASDMPPLFVITPEGAEIVNYRVQGQRYMVDRLFDIAELRLGTRAQIVVRIERTSVPLPPSPSRIGHR